MSPPVPPHAGKRILIVDDVSDNLSVLFAFLTERGFHVLAADSGAQALDELPQIAPDLILLDVMMPGIDGYETCRRIKADPKYADVPLFFLTALTDIVDKVKGFELGAVDYITKPLQPEEVLARVNAHLDLRALRLDLEQRNEELDREVQLRLGAEAALKRALTTPVLLLDRSGRVLFRSIAAEDLLLRHGGLPSEALRRTWLASLHEVEVTGSAGRLFVRRLPDPADSERALFVLVEKAPPASPEQLACLGLTPREAEILFWIAQGKTSPEIAVILDTAPATVKRHVHHLLGKLGVETRLAAALKAMEILGLPAPGP
jgi:DNA-binding response OmpR family regulator/DNA-binding CsgD family transcriptional regulator